MRILSKLTGGVAALALVATAATPAAARGWGWQGGYRHHDRGPDAGTVIGVIAAVGIFAAIASAATKKKEAAERRYDAPPPDDYGYYDNGAPRPRDDRYGDNDRRYDSRSTEPRYESHVSSEEDAAVDACAVAARDRASNGSNYAEIRGINGVTARGNGYDVTGQIEQRSSYRATDGWSRNFRCSWTDGRVASVTVD
ncbi:MAG: hypothetical protein J7485_10290 [Sphingobium sp.]|nr:hypothetical protein [Sphingobium sp.]